MLSEAPATGEWSVENWRQLQKERKARMGMPGPSLTTEAKRSVRERIDTLNERWRQANHLQNAVTSITETEELDASVFRGRLTIPAVFKVVSTYTGVPLEHMFDRFRKRKVVYARQLAIYLMRKHTQRSFPVMAKALGRDHSTIQYSVSVIRDLIDSGDEGVIADVEAVERRLGVLS